MKGSVTGNGRDELFGWLRGELAGILSLYKKGDEFDPAKERILSQLIIKAQKVSGGKRAMGETNSLLMGIDLGTSRTMVKTNRDVKVSVDSVIGYPKDIISAKVLGSHVAYGSEALEKRSYLDLFFPLEDGVLKEGSQRDIEAARDLLKHAVSLANPNDEAFKVAIIGVPAIASFSSKEALLAIAKDVLDVAMIVSEPFMVAYYVQKLTNSIIIDIGAGTADICGMKGTVPGLGDQVTILKGGDYIDKVLEKKISEAYPDVQMTLHLAKRIKEQHSFVGKPDKAVSVKLRVDGKPVSYDLTDLVGSACETIMPDIIEHLERIVIGFDPEEQETALQNIYLAGGGAKIRGLDKYISDHLSDYGDVKVHTVDDPDYAGCAGGLKLAMDLPHQYWDEVGDVIRR